MKLTHRLKIFSAYFGIVFTVSILSYYIFDLAKKSDVSNISNQNIENKHKYQSKMFIEFFDLYIRAAKSLSNNNAIKEYLNNANPDLLKEQFLSLKNTLPCVYQLRFIDIKGNEKINLKGKPVLLFEDKFKPEFVTNEKLQNKSQRDYFQKFIQLKEHEIGLSNIDLNMENGKVGVPRKPTLRVGTPIYNETTNELEGIIVLNVCLRTIFNKVSQTTLFNIYLINNKGDFLSHPDVEKSIYGDSYSKWNVSDQFPDSYKNILSLDSYSESNLFTKSIEGFNNNQDLKMILEVKFVKESLEKQVSENIYILLMVLISIILIPYVINSAKKEEYNEQLSSLVDRYNSYVHSISTDKNEIITYVSDAYAHLTGYTKEELIGSSFDILRFPGRKSTHRKDFRNAITNKRYWKGEFKNRKKDGSAFWVEVIVEPKIENGIIVGFNGIASEITHKKELENVNDQINNVLENIDEGVLFFNLDGNIQKGYSKESVKLFAKNNLEDYNIVDLLFRDSINEKTLFEKGLKYMKESDELKKHQLYLSLFPAEITLSGKKLLLKYKLLDNGNILLAIENISILKKLETKIEEQESLLRMMVAIFTNKEEFLDIKKSYLDFLNNSDLQYTDINIILKELHTFKGLFSQKGLMNTVHNIHEVENEIKGIIEHGIEYDKKEFYKTHIQDLLFTFEVDLSIVKQVLGNDYLEINDYAFKQELIQNVQKTISVLIDNNAIVDKEVLKTILKEILKLNTTPLYKLLASYPKIIDDVATKLNKSVNPSLLIGDPNLLVPNEFKPFVKSLVHVYRNCVDHGIESPDERVLHNKDEKASIVTKFVVKDNELLIQIFDDGIGIDIEKIKKIILHKNLVSLSKLEQMAEHDILMYIFNNNFTTKEQASLVSGRGIGLYAVKQEIDKLRGEINIINNYKSGVIFNFLIPAHNIIRNLDEVDIVVSSMSIYLSSEFGIEITNMISSDMYVPYPELSHVSTILLKGKKDIQCSIEFDDAFFTYCMAQYEIQDDTMKEHILSEVLNTVAGLSIQELNDSTNDSFSLTTPYLKKIDVFIEDMKNAERFKSVQIQTNKGNLVLSYIETRSK